MNSRFLTPTGIYLLSHSVGCLPLSAKHALEEKYFQPWMTQGGNAWETWLQQIEEFKTALAMLLGSNANAFCPQTNVSSALTKILNSFSPQSSKNVIVYSEHDFPSTGFAISQLKNNNFILAKLTREQSNSDLNNWECLLSPQTKAVFITHSTSDISSLAPVKQIIEIARLHNVVSIVDIAQSAGIIPISLEEWGADFVIGSSLKWLCGGPGAAFLWVNPDSVSQWRPSDVGWFSHESPFEFDINHFQYANDARRFWGGTPAIAPFIIATAGIKELLTFGIESANEHNRHLGQKIIDCADKIGLQIASPIMPEIRGGTVTVRFEEVDKMSRALSQNDIYFDVRQNNLFRFSPHIYNTEQQITQFCEIIQSK